ncbi:MAG: S-layer homology domain-containing protein, partial [Bacillota bacterium]|nr:S-layer homology domain-containing protein [Bacillota bacterium]
ENLTELQRADYTRFVKLLREKIPPGKEVSVAVASNPWGTAKGWQGSYDYGALGEYADYIFIMTYDEHYSGGSPGAVASLNFVEKSIQYALRNVPKEKIVVGIPFYGRLWSTDGSINGLGISLNRIQELIKKYPHKVFVDAASGSPVAHITVTDGFTLNGRTIKAGNYAIWYEDADSIKQKLALVGKYGLKGAGNWSAGQETPDVWDYYELWLNGHYFSDISDSFAKDDILRLSADGIVTGVTDTLFSPHTSLTRAQAAVIIARTLNLAEDSGGAGFSDTAGNWAEKEILAAEASGIIKGYDDGTFRPDERVSRAEISAMIARMINASYETRGEPMFKDVSANYWAFNEVTSLAKLNILRGYSDNTFRPGSNVTREEAAAIIERARNINAE